MRAIKNPVAASDRNEATLCDWKHESHHRQVGCKCRDCLSLAEVAKCDGRRQAIIAQLVELALPGESVPAPVSYYWEGRC